MSDVSATPSRRSFLTKAATGGMALLLLPLQRAFGSTLNSGQVDAMAHRVVSRGDLHALAGCSDNYTSLYCPCTHNTSCGGEYCSNNYCYSLYCSGATYQVGQSLKSFKCPYTYCPEEFVC